MDNVILVIRGQEFKALKSKLAEFSDYFRAMFSGNYVENEQTQVKIDVIDPNIAGIILQYIQIGLIDLSDHSLEIIEELAIAASFLQITELIKQIRDYLETHLCVSNWLQIMKIAESASFMELERRAAVHGLLSFKRMKPEHIPTINKLFWYLSHPSLEAQTEIEVFRFGHEWIMRNESGGDALLLILCCLDYKRLTIEDLKSMVELVRGNYINSLAEKIIECLHKHSSEDRELFISYFTKNKSDICENYTERVYKEVVNLMRSTITRKLKYTPAVPMWVMEDNKQEVVPHCLYTFSKETGFEKWLEVADKNLWGWNVISWGVTKIVVVCGERGRGTGLFMKDVRVYDVLKEEWTHHGVNLPSRRHAGLVIVDDSLYLLGGVGGYRVVLDSAIVYDLKQRTYRKIASLPDPIQSPAACVHNGEIYTCGHRHIYKYAYETNNWIRVVHTEIRPNSMVSFRGHIYITQNYFNHIYKLDLENISNVDMITHFTCPPAEMCHLGDRVYVFTRTICGHTDVVCTVEEFRELNCKGELPNLLWSMTDSDIKINDAAGSCVIIMTVPEVDVEISQFHKRYLDMFPED